MMCNSFFLLLIIHVLSRGVYMLVSLVLYID